MNGDQLMAKLLVQEGVEWLSCFPAQSLIEACAQEGIRPVLCRQERAGVNMADAYSRIHNGKKIGVFTMQQGPGAENAFGGVAQAYADNVPILVIPGGAPERRLGVHPGFDAVPNYHEAPIEPSDMLMRASMAMRQVRAEPRGANLLNIRKFEGQVS